MNIDVDNYFNVEKLDEIYNKKLVYSTTMGLNDRNNNNFRNNRKKIFEKICKDISEEKYKFSDYKVVLIPKDVNVPPRKICIATMRDRVVLEVLKQIIYDIYIGYDLNAKIGLVVEEFINTYKSNEYHGYIYADMDKFYDTISHRKLINKLKKITKDEWFLDLIKKTLVNHQKYKSRFINKKGVPQGLSISNVLANIYMYDFDLAMKPKRNIKYLRYVDDIFIFHNKSNGALFLERVKRQLNKSGLKLNEKKSKSCSFDNGESMAFLGYEITKEKITVNDTTKKRFEKNLEQVFKSHHYSLDKNKDRLEWCINLRITGAIIDDKRYGWLYYFSRIDDISLLRHLDYLIDKFKKRYKVEDIKTKSFIKVYREINYGKPNDSGYLLNVNNLTINDKKDILGKIASFPREEIEDFSDEKLAFLFKKNMFKSVRSLEMDLDGLS